MTDKASEMAFVKNNFFTNVTWDHFFYHFKNVVYDLID